MRNIPEVVNDIRHILNNEMSEKDNKNIMIIDELLNEILTIDSNNDLKNRPEVLLNSIKRNLDSIEKNLNI